MSKYIVGQNSIMDSSNSASPRMFTEGQEIPEDIIETYKKSDVLDILLKDGRIKEVKEDKEENKEDKEENQEENKEQSQETGKEESQQENTEQNQEVDKEESQQENIEQNQEVGKEESQQAEQKSAKQTKTKK